MKKLYIIILIGTLLFTLSGCEADTPAKESEITQVAPTSTKLPTKVVKQTQEIDVPLQPGFEGWKATDAVIALNKVLEMKAAVKVLPSQADNAEPKPYREDYLNNINAFMDYQFEQRMTPDRYSVVDMDHDGTPEVIVSLTVKEDSWILILRYYEGEVYGYPFEIRGFESPKTDGTYLASSGAYYNQIMQLSFDKTDLKESCLAQTTEKKGKREFYIASQKVTEKEYDSYYDKYDKSDDVKWNYFSSEIRAGYNGKELFHVDFKATTQPVSENIKVYYSNPKGDVSLPKERQMPQELCDLILEAMKNKNGEETLQPYRVGTKVSKEKYCKQTGASKDEIESVTAYRVDADNDGTEDLVGQEYWGGTAGFCGMQLYQGAKNSTYQLTNDFMCFLQDFNFIAYQGKNYLLLKDFDYNTKYDSGYSLYLYKHGTLIEAKEFTFDIKDYEMKVVSEDSRYSAIDQIRNTLCNKKIPEILNNNDGVINGTSESIDKGGSAQYSYSCDIDNDGKPEKYNKSMWYPSNMGTVMECNYDFKNSDVLKDLCDRLKAETGDGRLYTFWIDKINNQNIMYLYYGNNLDFTLYAYLLEKE